MIKEKSCGIVIFMEQNSDLSHLYLLLHYEEGHWDFTKGHMELGENEIKTALREAKEETCLANLELISGFNANLDYKYTRDRKKFHKTVSFFLARSKTKFVKLSHEHTGFLWLPYDKARERLTYENTKEILDKAHAFLSNK